jgi:hypothetical protein
MPEIDFNIRKSRLARNIEKWFAENRNEKLSFGQILDKYCKIGMSRRYVSSLIEKMTNYEIPVKDTPLWEAWKAEYAQRRTNFIFHSKFTGNEFHGNKGQVRSKREKIENEEEIKPIEITTNVVFICKKCGKKFMKNLILKSPYFIIGLKVQSCHHCKEYGTCIAKFQVDDEIKFKAIVDNQETFIEYKKNNIQSKKRTIKTDLQSS